MKGQAVGATQLLNDWRKASLALPLTISILLAVAIAAFAVSSIVTYRVPASVTSEDVTAFELKDLFDDVLTSARQVERGDDGASIATLISDAQSFDYAFMKLNEAQYQEAILSKGLERDFLKIGGLVARIDAFVTGDPTHSPATFTTRIENARHSVSAIASALHEHNNDITDDLRAKLSRDAKTILLLVSLFMFSLGLLLPVAWHRRKNILAKNRALEISEGKLRDLSFYRQQFLANMSHEFRTPLNAIQGFSEAILIQKDTMKQERIFEYVDIVARSARDLTKLTEDVLDLSKIDAGKFDIIREDTSFTQILDDSIVQFQSVAEHRDIAIRTSIEADWTVNCDRLGVKRCITNVLSNALKFSEKGGAIYVDAYMRDHRLLVVEVRDVGCGIPERDLQSIWMVYARSSLTRKSDREGAGLGLAMVKALMDAHSGFVELQSREGVGTSVRMCFPLTMVVATHWRGPADVPQIAQDRGQLKVG